MYIKIINDKPEFYTVEQLRRDNPHISFPQDIPNKTLEDYGLFPLVHLPAPAYNPDSYYLKQSNPYKVDGIWQIAYSAEKLPENQVAESARNKRDELLLKSDWIVSVSYEQGAEVPIEWRNYRQQLRDVTLQQGFPYEISWPTLIQG